MWSGRKEVDDEMSCVVRSGDGLGGRGKGERRGKGRRCGGELGCYMHVDRMV